MEQAQRKAMIQAGLAVLRDKAAHHADILREKKIIEDAIAALTAGLEAEAGVEKALEEIATATQSVEQLQSEASRHHKESTRLQQENATAKTKLETRRDELAKIAEREAALDARELACTQRESKLAKAFQSIS